MQVGDVTDNGTSDTDYAASIAAHTATPGSGVFRGGATSPTNYADFDQSYSPVNGANYQSTGSTYVAQDGDTLQSVAQQVWGDSSMWYLIADANGLSSDSDLQAGQSLIIPNKVTNIHNSSSTYKVYDPNQALGNVSPTIPKQTATSHGGCGVFGQILQAILTVVVSVFAGPVVGDVVGQVFGMAVGNQKGFNWDELGMSVVAAAVPPGLAEVGAVFDTGVDVIDAALNGALADAVTQGIGVATGLQKNFDWAGVAAAGVGAGAVDLVGQAFGGFSGGGEDGNVSQAGKSSVPGWAQHAIGGMAGAIANAATRTLINGSDFGDNIIAALPDTIGQTIGNAVAGGIAEGQTQAAKTDSQAGKMSSDDLMAHAQRNAAANLAVTMQHLDQVILNAPVDLSDLQNNVPNIDFSYKGIGSAAFAADAASYLPAGLLADDGGTKNSVRLAEIGGVYPIAYGDKVSFTQSLQWSDETFPAGPGQDGTPHDGAVGIQDAYTSGKGGTYWVDPKAMGMDHAIDIGQEIQESANNPNGYINGVLEGAAMNYMTGGSATAAFNSQDWYPKTGLMAFDDGMLTDDGRSVGRFGGQVFGSVTLNSDGSYTAQGVILLEKRGPYSFDLDGTNALQNGAIALDAILPNPHNGGLPNLVGKPVYLNFNRYVNFTVTGHWGKGG